MKIQSTLENMINKSKKNIPTREHVGVYGICLKDNNSKVLLILKGRGPYKGMYDLPGGSIEEGETKEEALFREYQEEIGSQIKSYNFVYSDLVKFPYKSQSQGDVEFQHTGHFYNVTLSDNTRIKDTPDGYDSMGAIFVDVDDVTRGIVMVAPIAKKAIKSALKKSQ